MEQIKSDQGFAGELRYREDYRTGDTVPAAPTPYTESELIGFWSDDSTGPLVSIVCHTFNQAFFVEQTLKGFLAQETSFPFEIIVHDDASTDGTQEVVAQFASSYPSIFKTLFQERNTFERGLRPSMFSHPLASGKYIAFCEGDDYWVDKSKLAQQVAFLEANPCYVVCYTNSVAFQDGLVLDKDFGGAVKDLTAEELQRAPAIFTLTACFRNVLDVPPEVSLVSYGDLFTWSRLGAYGKGKYLSDISPSMYRVHSGGMHSVSGSDKRRMMSIQTHAAIAFYYRRIGDPGLETYFLDKLKKEVFAHSGISIPLVPAVVRLSSVLRLIKQKFYAALVP